MNSSNMCQRAHYTSSVVLFYFGRSQSHVALPVDTQDLGWKPIPPNFTLPSLYTSRYQLNCLVILSSSQQAMPYRTQPAVRRSFQPLKGSRIYSVNVLNFQWTVFISDFMHMRDKTVCGF
eukprot:COSAG05_NODE_73_length_21807_cov_283.593698_13_plen_120_part_00